MYEGNGKYSWANGDRYEGQYVKNKKHGAGHFTGADGSHYHGEFKDGVKTGKKYTFF
jgi:hypothetical protein